MTCNALELRQRRRNALSDIFSELTSDDVKKLQEMTVFGSVDETAEDERVDSVEVVVENVVKFLIQIPNNNSDDDDDDDDVNSDDDDAFASRLTNNPRFCQRRCAVDYSSGTES